jgi:ligand-binding sensor domain-containing protein/CheY-like chemotaxis protein
VRRPASWRLGVRLVLGGLCLGGGPSSRAMNPDDYPPLRAVSDSMGLPRTAVRAIAQDELGIVWMGVEYAGLCRFDGSAFEVYGQEHGLAISSIEALAIDRERIIWAGTDHGVYRFDPVAERFEHFVRLPSDPGSLPGNVVGDLLVDRSGRLWAATSRGAAWFDGESRRWRPLAFVREGGEVTADVPVRQLAEDAEGALWIAGMGGVYRLAPEASEAREIPLRDGEGRALPLGRINALVESPVGTYWIGGEQGLAKYEKATGRARWVDGLPSGVSVWSLLVDRGGRVWVGSIHNGIWVFDPRGGEPLVLQEDPRLSDALGSNAIRSLHLDRDDQVWIGTKTAGVFIASPRALTVAHLRGSPAFPEGLRSHGVMALEIGTEGWLWAGTFGQGLYFKKDEGAPFEEFEASGSGAAALREAIVNDLVATADGLWLGLHEGLGHLDRGTGAFRIFPGPAVFEVERLGPGRLLLGSARGLHLFDEASARWREGPSLASAEGVPEPVVRTLFETSEGIWIVGLQYGGFFLYDPARGTVVPGGAANPALADAMVRAVLEDADGTWWLGTKNRGLLHFDPRTAEVRIFGPATGFPFESVFSLLRDDAGTVWLATHQGIGRLDPGSGSYLNLDREYGVQAAEFAPNAALRLASGEMVFGGFDGINRFDPARISSAPFFRRLLLTRLDAGSGQRFRDLDGISELRLRPGTKSLSVEFALTHFGNPSAMEYRYRLVGESGGWIRTGATNFVTFPALAPGTYRLEVEGIRVGQAWEEAVRAAPLRLVLPAAWYQTALFRWAGGVLLLGAIVLGYRVKMRRDRWIREGLEREVRERTTQLAAALEEARSQQALALDQQEAISARHRALREHRDELERRVAGRTAELERARHKAEASDRLKTAFLANFPLAVQVPLRSARQLAEALPGLPPGPSRSEHLQQLTLRGEAILRHVEGIIELALLESEEVFTTPRRHDLEGFLRELRRGLEGLLATLPEGSAELTVAPGEGTGTAEFEADAHWLHQLLRHLVLLGLERGHHEVQVVTKVLPAGREIEFQVRVGALLTMPAGVRGEDSPGEDAIASLPMNSGLAALSAAIVRRLARVLGGTLHLVAESAFGLQIHFRLPGLVTTPTRRDPSSGRHGRISRPDWSGRVVLVAEDQRSNFLVLERFLRDTGITIHHAVDGAEAIRLAHSLGPVLDLLLLDIRMPRKSGIEVLREVRAALVGVPALAQTAFATEADRHRLLEAGFLDVVPKPLSRQRLLRAVEECLRVSPCRD